MKLIIIGNGFDLHHNFKTSFSDFRTYLQISGNKDSLALISKIDELLDINTNGQKKHLLWNDFESIVGNIMNSNYKRHKVKDIPILLEEFTARFYEYLLNISKLNLPQVNKTLEREFEDASSILTFNYTSFYSSYLKKGNPDIFHIHGKLTESSLPIIGFYYPNIHPDSNIDYSIRYHGKLIHKPALGYKQNEINLDALIGEYTSKWKNKIDEVVVIGYSFGLSDSHIYSILNEIMIRQISNVNIPSSKVPDIQEIKFRIYNYNENETDQIIGKIKSNISSFKRLTSINITGIGFTAKQKDIITFELKDY